MSEPTLHASIRVNYKHVDGWHVFVSDELPGLCVAHKDAKTAYDDLPHSIEELIRLDEGIKVRVEREMTFEEFLQHKSPARSGRRAIDTPVLSDGRFAVYPLAA